MMAIKTERVEMRLESELAEAVDQWRGAESDVPSRSEAMRRLVEKGLKVSTSRRRFLHMRFQIMTAALTPGVRDKISDAYVYAWENDVYPGQHSAPWHKPYAEEFAVTEEMFDSFVKFLDDNWLAKSVPTFYAIEDIYKIRRGGTPWDRSKLIDSCRYLKLEGAFDDEFWKTLLSESPSEAQSIGRKFQRENDIFLL